MQSSLDGFQVCVFSYGQTGSGKTHTMQGGAGDNRGIIPRYERTAVRIGFPAVSCARSQVGG